jgi:hypothetical protein
MSYLEGQRSQNYSRSSEKKLTSQMSKTKLSCCNKKIIKNKLVATRSG